ncbi:MAG: aminotransferase class IV [Nocardioides sp.]|uniref:aminotransferase class IV n=1 Tax=Nocardioides sp. TaxID=35761 RepID=UPI0039E2F2E4
MHAWIDGRLLTDPTEPVFPVNDHGVIVGDGIFETLKVVDGHPFALDRHLARLAASARGLGLPTPDEQALRRGVAEVLGVERVPLARLRITLTSGAGPFGSARGPQPPTMVVATEAVAPTATTTSVVTVPWRRNEFGALRGLKTTSYAENVLALAEARRRGATEAILGNTQGQLCEGTGSNIFYVLDGELCTPTLDSGCLAGITRALVLEWYGGREVDAPLTEVAAGASEAFLVSTLRDVQAITRWDERVLPHGLVTVEARRAWRRHEPSLTG